MRNGYALLSELPTYRVDIVGDSKWEHVDEIKGRFQFKVDFNSGIVYFHESYNGIQIEVEYESAGIYGFPFTPSKVSYTDTEERSCSYCNGVGYITNLRFTGAIVSPFNDSCHRCNGTGKTKDWFY